MASVELNYPSLLTTATWNRIARFVKKLGENGMWAPREIRVYYSNSESSNTVEDLRKALSVYSRYLVNNIVIGPLPKATLFGDPYFLLKFPTYKFMISVTQDLRKIIDAGQISDGKTEDGREQNSDVRRQVNTSNNDKNSSNENKSTVTELIQQVQPYKNYIIVAVVVLLVFIIIKKI